MYEAQYHVRPKVIECDGELTKSNDIRKYVEVNKRMRLEPSAPGTQSQNGGAERAGALIKAKARAGAKLPAYLWKEIYQAAVYVGTCTTEPPSTCTGGPLLTTVFIPIWPTEMASWWKTGARNKGIFECKAFAMTEDALRKEKRRQRLNPKAWIGYLVGYNSTNIYRIWNPLTGKVIATQDVTFNEDVVFDGNMDTLKDDALHDIGRQELIDILKEIEVHPEVNRIPREREHFRVKM